MVARGDVVLALSNSGETDEVLAILPPLKRLGVPIVLLTGNPGSTLARQCEVVLDVSVAEEACPMNLAPTSSTTAALAMGDALAMALLEQRGLRPEDYAALHPRGALGWRASIRVADLMRSGDALPVVADAALLKDVIAEMTQKTLGMTTVVDAGGRLVGVITDGDLRRLHLRHGPIGEFSARDFMTVSPKLVDRDALAATALDVMEKSGPITSLVIVAEGDRPLVYEGEGRTWLRRVDVKVDERHRSWTIVGEEGDLDRAKNLEVRRNVVMTSDDGFRLETSVLRWHAADRRLWTDQPVRIVKSGAVIEGRALDVKMADHATTVT